MRKLNLLRPILALGLVGCQFKAGSFTATADKPGYTNALLLAVRDTNDGIPYGFAAVVQKEDGGIGVYWAGHVNYRGKHGSIKIPPEDEWLESRKPENQYKGLERGR